MLAASDKNGSKGKIRTNEGSERGENKELDNDGLLARRMRGAEVMMA